MSELPKIVQARLRMPTRPQPEDASAHPDADLLTAFYEQALPDGERQPVLAHLAQCADCRDALALALPPVANDAPQVPAVSGPAAAWGWSGWMRWASLAACVVVVATAVRLAHSPAAAIRPMNEVDALQLQSDRHATTEIASDDKNSAPAASKPDAQMVPPTSVNTPPAPTAKSANTTSESQSVNGNLPARVKKAESPTPSAQSVMPRQDIPQSPTNRQEIVAAQAKQAAAESSSTASEAVGGAMQGAMIALKPAAPRPQPTQAIAESQSAPKMVPEAKVSETIGRAKAGVVAADAQQQSGSDASQAVAARPVLADSFSKAEQRNPTADSPAPDQATAQWSLSPEGQLQRSFDQGKTWNAAPVVDRMKFTAWSNAGSDVWVGGAAGVLYHSADNGRTWTLVKPAAGEMVLTADITKLDFSDAKHGTVNTSDGQAWTTSDGGRNWEIKP